MLQLQRSVHGDQHHAIIRWMALPPYLMPDSERQAGEESRSSMHRGPRLVAVIVVVAAVSASIGVLVTRLMTDDRPSSTATTTTTSSTDGHPYSSGEAVTTGDWRIVVNDFRVTHEVEGLTAPERSNWLVTRFTVTNAGARARVFFAPEQVGLIYLTPALEKTPEFPPRGRGCASGYCEVSPEFGGDTHPVESGRTVHWHFVFRIPDRANGFRLAVRSSSGDLQNVGVINLSCC